MPSATEPLRQEVVIAAPPDVVFPYFTDPARRVEWMGVGALLDPVVDRLLVIAAGLVCWRFELLPRVALALLVARELFTLVAGRYAMKRGVELKINWWGRLAVTPVMAALFAGLVGWQTVGAILVWIGLAMALMATFEYSREVRRQLSRGAPSTSA